MLIARLHLLFVWSTVIVATAGAPSASRGDDLGSVKQIAFYVGTSAGAGYDLYARTVADYLPRHLPGNLRVVVQNMPSAAGLTLASQVFNISPSDGSVIAMSPASIVLSEVVDPSGFRYRSREFGWIGTLTTMTDVLAAFKSSGVNGLEDARTQSVTIGATGKLSNLSLYPALSNALVGTKFKIIHGYSGGNEINLAMENGEVQGRTNQWDSWESQKPDWIKEGKLTYLLQFGPKVPELGNTPRLADLVTDPQKKEMVNLIEVIELVGRSIFTSPKISPERLAIWRAAFDATMADPDYLARMKELGLDTFSRKGVDLQADLNKAMSNSAEIHSQLAQTIDLR